jgi:DNA helicase-2/ATP-dependent DNA helicase PcrA
MTDSLANPAEEAAAKSWEKLKIALDAGDSFVFEAGAGAGKTYSLLQTLDYLIEDRARELVRRKQQIACITFTRVARDMILTRTDRNPVVYCETTHAFAWDLMRQFKRQVREAVLALDAWAERLAEVEAPGTLEVDYELGHRVIEDGKLSLHHDDIFPVLIHLLDNAKFRAVLASRFPIILVDEYQDTDAALIAALERHFFGIKGAPQFGFYGDHWQKIYGDGVGTIEHPALARIDKGANFRSVKPVVDVLNRIRPELPQIERDPDLPGMIHIFHTNGWAGNRQTRNHWQGDLPADEARAAFVRTRAALEEVGWDFAPEHTKVLMLTQRALANELGYGSLPGIFRYNDAFARKADPHIAWFVDQLEPAALAFEARRFGAMFEALGRRAPPVRGAVDKKRWSQTMARILDIRANGTVGEMMAHLLATGLPELPEDVAKAERKLAAPLAEGEDISRRRIELEKLKAVPFTEITELARYHAGTSPFETKHGVKGDQFENVLGVFGRGWNDYNFDSYLRVARNPGGAANAAAFERARNLFYVVCSRPKERLALLFTQKLSEESLGTLTEFFGANALVDIGVQL